MSLIPLTVMYGHLYGEGINFAREPSGYLSIEAGIFAHHGLAVSWEYVQGPHERYLRLENGSAQISLVNGRASLRHFLDSGTTRILGCAMSSCPYYLMVDATIESMADLKRKVVACPTGPSRTAPLAETFQALAHLRIGRDISLCLLQSDIDTFDALLSGRAQAALVPRPYAFIAEERGFRRISDWPDVVDEPLPITIETTKELEQGRSMDFSLFLEAYRESITYLKLSRAAAFQMLMKVFGHSPAVAGKTCDEYLGLLDEGLSIEFGHLEKLLLQIAPDTHVPKRLPPNGFSRQHCGHKTLSRYDSFFSGRPDHAITKGYVPQRQLLDCELAISLVKRVSISWILLSAKERRPFWPNGLLISGSRTHRTK
jgi:ABC-type nitrate/sulfonate/bicarbonate transport system substrate-binding protein